MLTFPSRALYAGQPFLWDGIFSGGQGFCLLICWWASVSKTTAQSKQRPGSQTGSVGEGRRRRLLTAVGTQDRERPLLGPGTSISGHSWSAGSRRWLTTLKTTWPKGQRQWKDERDPYFTHILLSEGLLRPSLHSIYTLHPMCYPNPYSNQQATSHAYFPLNFWCREIWDVKAVQVLLMQTYNL